jgi:hypothetical protein
MRISILTVILPAIFLSGFMMGLYFTLLYQNRLHVLGQTGIFIPIISAYAGGVGGLKLIYDWSKELALKFDGTISKDVHYSIGSGRDLVTQLYCLRVKKKGVVAESSEGQIKVEGIDSDYYTTLWYNEKNPSVLIAMDEKYLRLFEIIEVGNQRKIRFYSVTPLGTPEIPYNDENINGKISAKIGSKNARASSENIRNN